VRERQLLQDMFDAVVAVASAEKAVPPNVPPPPTGRTVGVGAAVMARAVEVTWPADKPVAMRYGHGAGPLKRIEVAEAAHPDPDLARQVAAARILDLVQGLGLEDLALCLVSGGGSALLWLPAPGRAGGQAGAGQAALAKRRELSPQALLEPPLAVALRGSSPYGDSMTKSLSERCPQGRGSGIRS